MGDGHVPTIPNNGVGVNETESDWFTEAIAVVGEVIGFWGFKENHGRIWAFIYLHQRPMNTTEIREHLGLSKGAASMLLSDLESWSVILRDESISERGRFYVANPNFIEMIVHVMKRREADVIDGIAIGAVINEGKVIFPTPDTVIKTGDQLVLFAEKSAMKDIEQMFRVSTDYF